MVSLWADTKDAVRAPGLPPEVQPLDRALPDVVESVTEVLPVRIFEVFERAAPMTILRVFRGQVRVGQLEEYLAEAHIGTLADGRRPEGPGALVCATDATGGFVTASTWPDWPSIAACTGGDIRRPLTTRNAGRLVSGAPSHYELVAARMEPTERGAGYLLHDRSGTP